MERRKLHKRIRIGNSVQAYACACVGGCGCTCGMITPATSTVLVQVQIRSITKTQVHTDAFNG